MNTSPTPNKGKPAPKPDSKPGSKGAAGPKANSAGAADKKPKKNNPAPKIVVRPIAQNATMQKRHWGLILGFVIGVLLPLLIFGLYLNGRAVDQFASTVGFTVRQEDDASSATIIGGLAQFAGASGGASDSDIIYEFIQSQGLVKSIDDQLDLWAHYTQNWEQDPLFSLRPGGTIEDLHDFWPRIVRVSFDSNTGLLELRVLAFDGEFARSIANALMAESQALVNALNEQSRQDTLKYAEADLEAAVVRLKDSREAMIKFRTRTQIVDPESDLEARLGVQNGLQQQLAQALIDFDLLAEFANAEDPRTIQAQRRIDVIRARIAEERANLGSSESYEGVEGYPALIAEYESLAVDRQFAEETYRAALTALDIAKSNAVRQTRYLATYVEPTLPESAEYPRRWEVFGLTALFLSLAWAIIALIYYSVRDRR
ncbi:MAG: sugar transporter [Maritimibacter sp.]